MNFDLHIRQIATLLDQYFVLMDRPDKGTLYLNNINSFIELVQSGNGYYCRILDRDRLGSDGQMAAMVFTRVHESQEGAFEDMKGQLRNKCRWLEATMPKQIRGKLRPC